MSKLAPTSIKYIIKAHIKAKGVIEKPDVIGAIFGQTEGLLGSGLDLRELQRTGRIGRIEVNIKSSQGNSEGEIIIPSSLDSAETALIAATLETIERVGPCTAKITLESVDDTRASKRKHVVDKAQEILKGLMESNVDSSEVSEQIKESVRAHEITSYHGLPAGPDLLDSDAIIIVEGRADVINLLRHGIKNIIAIEGTSISKPIVDLAKEKNVTLFVDGDRGGKLIVKELMQKTDIDYVAVAPEEKEVEELSQKETYKALRDKRPVEQLKSDIRPDSGLRSEKPHDQDKFKRGDKYKPTQRRAPEKPPTKPIRLKPGQKDFFKKTLEDLVGSRAAYIFNEKNELLGKVPVTELINTIKTVDSPYAVIFDGKVDYDLASMAKRRGVRFLVGMEKDRFNYSPIMVLCKDDLK